MGVLDAHLVPAVDGVAYGLLLFVAATIAFPRKQKPQT